MWRSLKYMIVIATVGLACWPAAAVDRPASCERWGTGEVRCSSRIGPDFEDVFVQVATGKLKRKVKFKFEVWDQVGCFAPDLDGKPSKSEDVTYEKNQSYSYSKGYKAPSFTPVCFEAFFTQCTVNGVTAECHQVLGFN